MKATVIIVLICLPSSVMKVYSQVFPYIRFMGKILPNNSYINFEQVGINGNSVQCHTDLPTCCSGSEGSDRGDWYFPNGSRLLFVSYSLSKIYEARQAQRVDLRRYGSPKAPQGIYRCDIRTTATSSDNQENLYVGLYRYSEGGDVTISDPIEVIVKSDLKRGNPQFSLICISTGGPATTVTWTRDIVEVSGGMTVLDDPVSAQYTHTLTVTGRLEGQYQCNVSNNKPSNATKSVTFQAATVPTNFMVFQESPTGIRISWTPPTPLGITTGYRIFYSDDSSGFVDISGGMEREHLLTGLWNGANYTISIMSTSEHLYSELVIYPSSISLIPGMPIAKVNSTTATTISISWSVPLGVVESYMVTWERDTSGECPVINKGSTTLSNSFSSYTIEQLEEDSSYITTLRAINAAGSTVSDVIITMTKEAVPSAAPASLRTSTVTISSITVQWRAVKCIYQNGKITGYLVRYWAQRNSTKTAYALEGATTTFTLTGLLNLTTYSIDVAAVNNAGTGVYSDPITVKTKGNSRQKGEERRENNVGGAVGGVIAALIMVTLLVAILITGLYRWRKRTYWQTDMRGSLPEVAEERKHDLPTSTNIAYGCVEHVGGTEFEMQGMPSAAAMATQEPVYETVPM